MILAKSLCLSGFVFLSHLDNEGALWAPPGPSTLKSHNSDFSTNMSSYCIPGIVLNVGDIAVNKSS